MTDKNFPTTPFDRSYWVIPGKFLAGYYPGDRDPAIMKQKMRDLLDCGIRCTINLMEPDERDQDGLQFVDYAQVFKALADGGPPVSCHRTPIRDLGTPSYDHMIRILDLIDDALKQEKPVYIHCWGGRGRTGTVVGCWFVRNGIAEGKGAIELIRKLRRYDPKAHWPSPEMPEQIEMVLSWKNGQ